MSGLAAGDLCMGPRKFAEPLTLTAACHSSEGVLEHCPVPNGHAEVGECGRRRSSSSLRTALGFPLLPGLRPLCLQFRALLTALFFDLLSFA